MCTSRRKTTIRSRIGMNAVLAILIPYLISTCLVVADTSAAELSCLKPVNGTLYPRCQISFREEGTFQTFNATCLEQNVFLISSNRTQLGTYSTPDREYFSALYDENVPPYARISCTSTFNANFEFQGVGALDFFRVWKGQQRNSENTTYTINAEALLSPEATGRYVFRSADNASVKTTIFIFSERGSLPNLIGGNRLLQAIKRNRNETLLPCVASDLVGNLTLYKFSTAGNQSSWVKVNKSAIAGYNRQDGFTLRSPTPGDYRCYSNLPQNASQNILSDSFNDDYVTVHVKSAAEANQTSLVTTKLGFEIVNSRAICYTSDPKIKTIHFSNAYTQNPTESRLLIQCLKQDNGYCGSHSYHNRQEGRKFSRRPCPKNATICSWISKIHPQGIFYCESSTSEDNPRDSISKEYFTGLDHQIYDTINVDKIPSNLLLLPKVSYENRILYYSRQTEVTRIGNTTNLQAGKEYVIRCEAVGLILMRDPFTILVKFKNGTTSNVADVLWYQGGKKLVVTHDMDEIVCSDSLWETNKVIASAIKVNATEIQCKPNEYKCRNEQCISATLRCDGGKDCEDGSDETNCTDFHCKPTYFQCTNRRCINNYFKCNNKDDCGDGSDESLQTCANETCSNGEFKCTSGQCISSHRTCDLISDCFDKSDESERTCSNFYPNFVQMKTKASFTLNQKDELVCEIRSLPDPFRPTLSWKRKGNNITEPDRFWQDNKGLKLALRFPNISQSDSGEYTCVATNILKQIELAFSVTVVEPPEPDFSCNSAWSQSICTKRRCFYIQNQCGAEPETTTTTATTTTTTKATNTTATTSTASTASPTSSQPEKLKASSSGGIGVSAAVIIVVLVLLTVLLLMGFNWNRVMKRLGICQRDEDQESVLGEIPMQTTNA